MLVEEILEKAIIPSERTAAKLDRAIVDFDGVRQDAPLSVRTAFRGKHILLIGVTGFIGKVWLANTLMDLAGRWMYLSADPAAEVESSAEALREIGRRVSGI